MGQVSLSVGDWVAVAVFMALIVGMALWVKFNQKGSEDYFLAGRSMPWIVVAISTYATLFSTIGFVATPGEAYAHGLMLSLWTLVAFVYPVAVWLFLRFFFQARTFTAYEYLERRFNLPTRLMGASIYVLIRLLYAGTVLYATGTVFESMIGWDPMTTILLVGGFTIIYASTGGMKAVMFTDVVQGIVVLIGITLIGYKVLYLAGFDVGAIYSYVAAHGHGYGDIATTKFWRLDLHDRFSFWLLLLYLVTAPIQAVTADQSTIQRLLSSKSYASARRAVITQAFANIPIAGTLWLIGIGLFFYYGTNPGLLPDDIKPDQVFGYFINTQMPTPMPGLIVAALLAALMSTLDSTVNCIANVVHRDGLVRLGAIAEGHPREMLICRGISIVAGLVGLGCAVLLTVGGEGVKSSVMEIAGIWGSLWGVLMMAFVIGVLVPRVGGRAMFCGLLVGGLLDLILPYVLYYNVPADERISFLWVGVPGMVLAGLVPLAIAFIKPNTRPLVGLTHWTLGRSHGVEADQAESNIT